MPPFQRSAVDSTFYEMFEQTSLNLEETRRLVSERLDTRLGEVEEHAAGAEREAQRSQDRLTRVRRAFQDGKLDAEDWTEQRRLLTDELAAAEAAASRLREQVEEVRGSMADLDGESEVLRALATLRKAIAGKITDAEAMDPLRAAVAQIFDRVEVVADEAIPGGGFYLVPHVRQDLIDALDPGDDIPMITLGLTPANNLTGSGLSE